MGKSLLFSVVLLLASSFVGAEPLEPRLPSGERWLVHLTRDILPYWSSPEALGEPIGRFPTFRYPDGEPIEADRPLRSAYREMGDWLALRLDRTYTRMVSRQAFVLGVGYHLTGDGRFLAMAKAGVDWILSDLMDDEGTFCSWIELGRCAPDPPQRTSQDLAYALLGPAFYAYLSHDPEVIDALLRAQKRLFAEYRDDDSGLLRWVLEPLDDPPDRHSPGQLELVAQLDQINAYLLLLAPLIPESDAARWREDLKSLSQVMVDRFFDEEHNVFWGRIDSQEYRRLGGHPHTDSGHTAKAFWMLSRVARLTGDKSMARFAHDGGMRLLGEVFLEPSGSWSSGWTEEGVKSEPAIWWAFAELNQLAATLALDDPTTVHALVRTYDFWLTYFVDHRRGGTWVFPVDPTDDPPYLKSHLWKSGYHSAEHALVAYLTSNALLQQPVTLYFAPAEGNEPTVLHPYYFQGEPEIVRRLPLEAIEGHERLEVRFRRIR